MKYLMLLVVVALGSVDCRRVNKPEPNQFREIINPRTRPSDDRLDDLQAREPLLLRKRRTTCGTPSVMSSADQQSAIVTHNSLRGGEKAANVRSLTFSQALADRAQQWTATCNWFHGDYTSCTDGHQIGQNLYMIGGGTTYPTLNITAAIISWFGEKSNWNAATSTCAAGTQCGHYTQLVWANSGSMGCGWSKCPSVAVGTGTWSNCIIFGCDYDPPGNVDGQSMYQVGTVCSKCATVMQEGYICQNNLCTPCSKATTAGCQCPSTTCLNGGVYDSTNCVCKCSSAHWGYDCSMNCTCADNMDCSTSLSYCTDPSYSSFMLSNCAKSCNICPVIPAGSCGIAGR